MEKYNYTDKQISDLINFDGIGYYSIITSYFDYNTNINSNKYEIQKELLGYTVSKGYFPYCETKEDAIKLFKHFINILNGDGEASDTLESELIFEIL